MNRSDPARSATPVPSPCTRICVLDAATQVCRGCLRRIDEIVEWPAMDDERRRAVLARIERARRGGGA